MILIALSEIVPLLDGSMRYPVVVHRPDRMLWQTLFRLLLRPRHVENGRQHRAHYGLCRYEGGAVHLNV
jgi:hypothetical protein